MILSKFYRGRYYYLSPSTAEISEMPRSSITRCRYKKVSGTVRIQTQAMWYQSPYCACIVCEPEAFTSAGSSLGMKNLRLHPRSVDSDPANFQRIPRSHSHLQKHCYAVLARTWLQQTQAGFVPLSSEYTGKFWGNYSELNSTH